MDNIKDDRYYLNRIITDLSFILAHTVRITSIEEFESEVVLLDSVMFRLILISENSDRLTPGFKEKHAGVQTRAGKWQ